MRVAVRISDIPGGGEYNVPEEGSVTSWQKNLGDHVNKGEDLFEFENEKAVVVAQAPISGILVDVAFGAGSIWHRGELLEVKDGTPMYDPPFCWIETDIVIIETPKVVVTPPIETNIPEVTRVVLDQPVVLGSRRKKRQSSDSAHKRKPTLTAGAFALLQKHSVSVDDLLRAFPETILLNEQIAQSFLESLRHVVSGAPFGVTPIPICAFVRAVPAARARAKELDIPLTAIPSSGPDGVVLLHDVELAYEALQYARTHQGEVERVDVPRAPQDDEIIHLEMSRLLRAIVVNMEKANRIPTVDGIVTSDVFDFIPLTTFHQRFRKQLQYGLWFPIMVATARVLGREEFITFNSFFPEQDMSPGSPFHIAARKNVHMGIAYDRGEAPVIDWEKKTIGGEGLRILVIRDANIKTVSELIADVARLLKAAASRRFSLGDVSGYTFIFNNLGVIGHRFGRSLLGKDVAGELNLGQVDVVAGTGILQVVVDHRVINGARITPFARAIHKEMVEHVLPELEIFLFEK